MKWVLFYVVLAANGDVIADGAASRFKDEAACQEAAALVRQLHPDHELFTSCRPEAELKLTGKLLRRLQEGW